MRATVRVPSWGEILRIAYIHTRKWTSTDTLSGLPFGQNMARYAADEREICIILWVIIIYYIGN